VDGGGEITESSLKLTALERTKRNKKNAFATEQTQTHHCNYISQKSHTHTHEAKWKKQTFFTQADAQVWQTDRLTDCTHIVLGSRAGGECALVQYAGGVSQIRHSLRRTGDTLSGSTIDSNLAIETCGKAEEYAHNTQPD
jgi:hypothetical protein